MRRMAIQSIYSKTKAIRRCLKDVSLLKTLYYNYKFKLYSHPILIYPNVHIYLSSQATIVNNGGRLKVGRRWYTERFRPSEFVIHDNGILEINGDCEITTGCSILVDRNAKLSFGSANLNFNSQIRVHMSVSFGDDVYIGENVTIRDSDNHSISCSTSPKSAPIIIGNHVWIGINVTILKGVNISDGAVVAANSLVNRNVPPNTLVGGLPAKVLRENITWSL
jgi:acetyltransferase-like isoleucine patch superfamily enzyme